MGVLLLLAKLLLFLSKLCLLSDIFYFGGILMLLYNSVLFANNVVTQFKGIARLFCVGLFVCFCLRLFVLLFFCSLLFLYQSLCWSLLLWSEPVVILWDCYCADNFLSLVNLLFTSGKGIESYLLTVWIFWLLCEFVCVVSRLVVFVVRLCYWWACLLLYWDFYYCG